MADVFKSFHCRWMRLCPAQICVHRNGSEQKEGGKGTAKELERRHDKEIDKKEEVLYL